DRVPARQNRPLSGDVDLTQGHGYRGCTGRYPGRRRREVAVEAIARADHLGDLGCVARRHRVALRATVLLVVLHRAVEGQRARWAAYNREQQVRLVTPAQRDTRKGDPLVLEVVALADRAAEQLDAAGRQEARGRRERQLARVAEAVAADKPVFVE